MRSEQEMFELILQTAREDARILAVYMNGSRTNRHVPKDRFQDYDIVYVVKETGSFIKDRAWIQRFGEILYMQYPDEWPDVVKDIEQCYGWLMQFADGNRMDLHVVSASYAKKTILQDRLCQILLDKEGILPSIPEATDEDFWVKKPNEEQYRAVCNEFWWCTNNIAKGLWRGEFPYVQEMTNEIVRPQLKSMLSWKVGILTMFQVSVGKSAKYMYRWLEQEEWQNYLATWFPCEETYAWEAVMRMCKLFEETAKYVGKELGYSYNETEGRNALEYLVWVRTLSKETDEKSV